jgi:hypothetical protein
MGGNVEDNILEEKEGELSDGNLEEEEGVLGVALLKLSNKYQNNKNYNNNNNKTSFE